MFSSRDNLVQCVTRWKNEGNFQEKFKLQPSEYEQEVYEKVIQNIRFIKFGHLYHVKTFKGLEYIMIPERFTTRAKVSCIMVARSYRQKRIHLTSHGYILLKTMCLKHELTPIDIKDLPLYIRLAYPTKYMELFLNGTLTTPLRHIPKGV